MLIVVATPIGNLEDISQRAISALAQCDAILCEDTRQSAILLQRLNIRKPLIPYHKFTENKLRSQLIERLRAGENLVLISDAGTPCISDPGEQLLASLVEENLPFQVIPGPCSIIQALVVSAFPSTRFQYVGFLPKNPTQTLRRVLHYPGTTVAFESPKRLLATLSTLQQLDPCRHIAIAREMTKMFEECIRGTAQSLLAHFQKTPPLGEIVLVIGEGTPPEEPLDVTECVHLLRTLHGLSTKDAIKQASRLLHTPKSSVYKKIHQNK